MKIIFPFLFLISLTPGYAGIKTENPPLEIRGAHLTLGFSDRLSHPSHQPYSIKYFNQGTQKNDTFSFNDRLKSNAHLIAFNIGFSANFRYVGAKINIGFVPIGYRNGTQNISLFGLIPISEKVAIVPEVGYTRFRKEHRIGEMRAVGKNKIEFNDGEYDLLVIKTKQVTHSWMYGLGIHIDLGLDYKLYISGQYHSSFWTNTHFKINAYTQSETFLRIADSYDTYRIGNSSFTYQDGTNKTPNTFYNIRNIAFNIMFCIPLEDLQGEGFNPKKFMGAQ